MRTSKTGPTDRKSTVANETSIVRVVAAVSISALLTLGLPEGMHLPALSALLFLGAFVASTAALFYHDELLPPELTRWDEAAALLTLSLLIGWLGDAGTIDSAGR